MSFSDMTGGFAQSIPLRADLQARLADFLARKELPFSKRIEALLRLAESTLSPDRIKSAMTGLLSRFRRERLAEEGAPPEGEWEILMDRIHRARGEATIENYTAYLIKFDSSI